jgi:hypothetical protein
MTTLDTDLLDRVTGGMRLPPQLPAVIRGPAGGIPLVIDPKDGGPPFVIRGPRVGPLL